MSDILICAWWQNRKNTITIETTHTYHWGIANGNVCEHHTTKSKRAKGFYPLVHKFVRGVIPFGLVCSLDSLFTPPIYFKYWTSQGSLGDFHVPSCCLRARVPFVLDGGFRRGLFSLQWDFLTARSPVPRTVRDNRVDR